jgi:hypothetical protein
MTDTPDHIKKMQLQIWPAKAPMERLRQFLRDNDEQYKLWNDLKKKLKTKS